MCHLQCTTGNACVGVHHLQSSGTCEQSQRYTYHRGHCMRPSHAHAKVRVKTCENQNVWIFSQALWASCSKLVGSWLCFPWVSLEGLEKVYHWTLHMEYPANLLYVTGLPTNNCSWECQTAARRVQPWPRSSPYAAMLAAQDVAARCKDRHGKGDPFCDETCQRICEGRCVVHVFS